MYLVGHITAPNGMATWCWEAAHGLAAVGAEAVLVADEHATLPGTPAVEIIRTPSPKPTGRWQTELARLRGPRDSAMLHAVDTVRGRGQTVDALLLNASSLVLPDCAIPQCVVAWAYPPTLRGYLRKVPLQAPLKSLAGVRTTLEAVGWFRRDHAGFPEADVVMAVTPELAVALRRRLPEVIVVRPGTHVVEEEVPQTARRGFLVVAADLQEPRKGVRWMLDALARTAHNEAITLVGRGEDAWQEETVRHYPSVSILPPCNRDELRVLMHRHATLLFGSRFDDWGYVVTEAMGAGMAVVAPRQPPFTSIAGDFAYFYEPGSMDNFAREAVASLNAPSSLRTSAARMVQERYGRIAFGAHLLSAAQAAARRRATATAS